MSPLRDQEIHNLMKNFATILVPLVGGMLDAIFGEGSWTSGAAILTEMESFYKPSATEAPVGVYTTTAETPAGVTSNPFANSPPQSAGNSPKKPSSTSPSPAPQANGTSSGQADVQNNPFQQPNMPPAAQSNGVQPTQPQAAQPRRTQHHLSQAHPQAQSSARARTRSRLSISQ